MTSILPPIVINTNSLISSSSLEIFTIIRVVIRALTLLATWLLLSTSWSFRFIGPVIAPLGTLLLLTPTSSRASVLGESIRVIDSSWLSALGGSNTSLEVST
jgi:hypothetical protein